MLVIKELNDSDQNYLELCLHDYDHKLTQTNLNKKISYGYYDEGVLVAGITGKIEGFKILYIETLFVLEGYRKNGLGKLLLKQMEDRAKFEGVILIRLDTFSWQAKDFYILLGYELISSYELIEGYSEYFFIKRL